MVYDYLEDSLRQGKIRPGSEINLEKTSRELGVSRTPLRDALLQLASEGFVEIIPRKGIRVKELTLNEIRYSYQIIGALEAAVIRNEFRLIDNDLVENMENLNDLMREALKKNDFALFYQKNLEFHNSFLRLSANQELLKIVDKCKKRLYNFPPQENWLKEWEVVSVEEHQTLIDLLRRKEKERAARQLSDVHWSFRRQEKFIRRYYFFED